MTHPMLRDRAIEMSSRVPAQEFEYYAITLLGDEDGNLWRSCYSHWEGYVDKESHVELRAASIVQAERVAQLWRQIGESCLVINDVSEMAIFLGTGGHAVIEKSIAETVVGEWLGPTPVRMSGRAGFVHVNSLPKSSLNRAPTQKLRMKVLQRDDYRCRICGRRAADYVDVELHVHHIRPWASGGLTEEKNLITICHTCHKGLDPHFSPSLYDLIESRDPRKSRGSRSDEFWTGVRLYRENFGRM